MPFNPTALAQIDAISDVSARINSNPAASDRLNNAIFGVSNMIGVHPHDLAIYILIRTTRL